MDTAREQVAAVANRLAAEGLVLRTSGNVSARVGERIAITPTGAVLADIGPADVTTVDLEGRVVDGAAPTSEIALHLGAYRRYGAGAVVHAHAPHATALSAVLDEVPCVHYDMQALGGAVRVAPYATFGTEALAEAVLDALEDRSAALMANHGAITIGDDLAAALDRMRLLEWVCTVYWRAAAIGTPRVLGDAEMEAVAEVVRVRAYGR